MSEKLFNLEPFDSNDRVEINSESLEQSSFSPEDELDTEGYIEFLQERDSRIEEQARSNLSDQNLSEEEYPSSLEREIHRLKYFPVLFVSAPHIGEEVSGVFPGEPTPLMYATSVLDRYVRSDTFPADTSPEVLGMMNPGQYNDEFIEQLVESIKTNQPRVVGISNTSEGHFFAGEIARLIKENSPETLIVLGGSHEDGVNADAYLKLAASGKEQGQLREQTTLHNEEARKLFDVVVSGDAPYALTEILKVIANNKDKNNNEITEEILKHRELFSEIEGDGNISVVNGDNEVETIPLSGMPLDWNKLPLMFRGRLTSENRFSIFDGKKTAQIMTQMGCKYSCSFCMESLSADLYKTNASTKPTVERALAEIEMLINEYEYEAIFFDDSTFTQIPRRVDKLMEGIIALQEKEVEFEWGCQTAFADIPDKEFLEKMKQAGCTYIYFGFEQIEESIGGRGKPVQLEKVEEVLGWCKEIELRSGVSLQFGLGGKEGSGEYKATVDYIGELYSSGLITKNSIAININTPYPGTEEWLKMEDKPDFNQELQRHPRFESAHQLSSMTMDRVNEIYAYARQKIGDGLIGVEYSNQEIQQHLERYRREFSGDFYFDDDQYGEYLAGDSEALHLNHASISNRSNEMEEINQLTADFSESDWENVSAQAREVAGGLIGVEKEGVVFGRNTTEVTKLISLLVGMEKGDRVLLTNAENRSIPRLFEVNMDHGNPTGEDPWSAFPTFYHQRGKKYGETVDELTGVETDVVDVVNEDLDQIYENIATNLTADTKCFVISHVIRDTGQELPVKDICEFVREKKSEINPDDPEIFIIIDGAQALGNIPQIDFTDIGCDAYVGTPHKTMGSTPVGLGFFDPDSPVVRKNLPKLNKLFWQDEQVILDGMFDPSVGVKSNVDDSIDRRDVFGFTNAMDHLSENGYEDGNFEQISAKRLELKNHFRDNIQSIVSSYGLEMAEVDDGTDFIYSFSISGIDNREFVKQLSDQGIFVSYIDRTKLQEDDDKRVGNGVIRVSFGIDNTKEEIDAYRSKINDTLGAVIENEFASFESKAEEEMIFKEPNNIVYLSSWIRKKTESPITKIAIAASILLMVLSHDSPKISGDISIDQAFAQSAIEELVDQQATYAHYRELFEHDGFQHRVMEEMSTAEYMVEKYKLLTSIDDEKKINDLLSDDASLQLAGTFDFSDSEREQLESVYKQTKNGRLGQVLKLVNKYRGERNEQA
jgi:selenocysteine lyase/cysteine desulfurase/radical SAM superfamily enzyme YgiQ (UPF0313 family)